MRASRLLLLLIAAMVSVSHSQLNTQVIGIPGAGLLAHTHLNIVYSLIRSLSLIQSLESRI